MTIYRTNGKKIASGSPGFQEALKRCREQQIPVYCTCKAPNPLVNIVKSKNIFYLKRRPLDGASHAAWCFHYGLPPSVSGHHTIADATKPVENGKIAIRVGVRLSERGPRTRSEPSNDDEKPVSSASPKPATLKAFLEFLFERSGLTEWRPEFNNRRSYRLFRDRIQIAARNITMSSGELASRLFIPETYDPAHRSTQAMEARDWFETFGADSPNKQFAILIAELEGISETDYGGRLDLKHLYEKMFFLDQTAYSKTFAKLEKLEKRFDGCTGTKKIIAATCDWRGKYAIIDELDIVYVNEN